MTIRRAVGYLVAVLGLGLLLLLFLRLWDLAAINFQFVAKVFLTAALVAAAAVLLAVVRWLFFKDWSHFRPFDNRRPADAPTRQEPTSY